MKAKNLVPLTLAAGVGALTGAAFLTDLKAAKRRISSNNHFIDGIEFAESGDGPPVLVIHGAGGGWDQGLELGRNLVGDGHRIIAPSRFGYLGTPLPDDASPEAQAAVHVRLLDALGIDRLPVVGVSAGAPSALQFCLNHADRCSALILIVPLTYPAKLPARNPRMFVSTNFLYWTAMKIAHLRLVETVAGTPIPAYWLATDEDRRDVDTLLRNILPVSRRAAGIANDSAIGSSLKAYALEDIHVPTLVVAAEDCLYGTYDGAVYTAAHVPGSKLVTFKRGGHLLVGHKREVQLEIATFLPTQQIQPLFESTSTVTSEKPEEVNA